MTFQQTITACCGCFFADDYGTSEVDGDGSDDNPFTVQQIDPNFKRPIAKVNRVAPGTQAIPTGTPTALTYNNVQFDTNSMFNGSTRMTAVIEGHYLMGMDVPWASSPTVFKRMRFRKNGTDFIHSVTQNRAVASAFTQSLQYVTFLNIGEYIEVVVDHNQGSNLDVSAVGSRPSQFWMVYLGKRI